jgi:hypothetical protein
MKLFAAWLLGTLLAFGAPAGASHLMLTSDPSQVAVVLDSSYPMTASWHRVPGLLRALDERRYTQFSLATERNAIHGWQPRLTPGQLSPYGPRDFEKLRERGIPGLAEADRVVLVTNAPESELEAFGDWEILRP